LALGVFRSSRSAERHSGTWNSRCRRRIQFGGRDFDPLFGSVYVLKNRDDSVIVEKRNRREGGDSPRRLFDLKVKKRGRMKRPISLVALHMRYQADLPVPFHEPLMRFDAHNTLRRCYKTKLWSIFNTTCPQNPLDSLAVC
jgi:hypothetical protein